MSKPPRYLKLNNDHPSLIKFEKLCEFADQLGISFSWTTSGIVIFDRDRDKNLPCLLLEDIEPNSIVTQFPPSTEYKIIYDNPEFLDYSKNNL